MVTKGIHGIHDPHVSCTLNAFCQLLNDHRVGQLTVNLNPEVVQEDGV